MNLAFNECGNGFEAAIIAFVCISFILSHFKLEENRIFDKSIYKYAAIIRVTRQILLAKRVFLGLPFALFLRSREMRQFSLPFAPLGEVDE